jgi:hypothetical protein
MQRYLFVGLIICSTHLGGCVTGATYKTFMTPDRRFAIDHIARCAVRHDAPHVEIDLSIALVEEDRYWRINATTDSSIMRVEKQDSSEEVRPGGVATSQPAEGRSAGPPDPPPVSSTATSQPSSVETGVPTEPKAPPSIVTSQPSSDETGIPSESKTPSSVAISRPYVEDDEDPPPMDTSSIAVTPRPPPPPPPAVIKRPRQKATSPEYPRGVLQKRNFVKRGTIPCVIIEDGSFGMGVSSQAFDLAGRPQRGKSLLTEDQFRSAAIVLLRRPTKRKRWIRLRAYVPPADGRNISLRPMEASQNDIFVGPAGIVLRPPKTGASVGGKIAFAFLLPLTVTVDILFAAGYVYSLFTKGSNRKRKRK